MKIRYDKRFDIADTLLSSELSELMSEIVREDIILDFSGDVLVRIEVQRASRHLKPALLKAAEVYSGVTSG